MQNKSMSQQPPLSPNTKQIVRPLSKKDFQSISFFFPLNITPLLMQKAPGLQPQDFQAFGWSILCGQIVVVKEKHAFPLDTCNFKSFFLACSRLITLIVCQRQ